MHDRTGFKVQVGSYVLIEQPSLTGRTLKQKRGQVTATERDKKGGVIHFRVWRGGFTGQTGIARPEHVEVMTRPEALRKAEAGRAQEELAAKRQTWEQDLRKRLQVTRGY